MAVLHLEEPIEGPLPSGIYDPAAGGYEPDFRYHCTDMVAQGFGTTLETKPRGLYTIPYEIGYASSLYTLETAPINPDQGVCNGDSGGGLYAYMEDHPWAPGTTFWIAGIAIQGYNENCLGRTRHTYLESYSGWIQSVLHCMKEGTPPTVPWYMIGPNGDIYQGHTCEGLRK
jgi:hypothetical protein